MSDPTSKTISWTDRAVQRRIINLLDQGQSATQIAEVFSRETRTTITRSAVLGAIFRNDLSPKRKKAKARPVRSEERDADWQIIRALRTRVRGYSWPSVAKIIGADAEAIKTACLSVVAEDVRHEPEAVSAYHWMKSE